MNRIRWSSRSNKAGCAYSGRRICGNRHCPRWRALYSLPLLSSLRWGVSTCMLPKHYWHYVARPSSRLPSFLEVAREESGAELEHKINATTCGLFDVLDHHEKAVKAINGCLTKVNCSLDELQASQRALVGEIVRSKELQITEDNISIFTVSSPKTEEISQALATNDVLLETASDIRKKLTEKVGGF